MYGTVLYCAVLSVSVKYTFARTYKRGSVTLKLRFIKHHNDGQNSVNEMFWYVACTLET